MRSSRCSALRLVIAAVLLASVGCGGAEGDKFKGDRGSVTGKITYKDASVPAGSNVLFQSKEGSYAAGGKVNDKGEYTLAYDGGPQLPAVAYKVQIGLPPVQGGTVDLTKVGSAPATTEAASPFPAKYTATATSGLEFAVKKGPNTANFELTD